MLIRITAHKDFSRKVKVEEKSHGQDLGNQQQDNPLDVKSNFVAKTSVCISSLVVHGEQCGEKKPAAKPTG
jgi:hypothetical protein